MDCGLLDELLYMVQYGSSTSVKAEALMAIKEVRR